MANFTKEQREYIGTTIVLAISQQSDQIGTIMAQGKATQGNVVEMIEGHNKEMHESADHVSKLAENASQANSELKGSTGKIDEAEKLMASLMADLQTFESNQVYVLAA